MPPDAICRPASVVETIERTRVPRQINKSAWQSGLGPPESVRLEINCRAGEVRAVLDCRMLPRTEW